MTLNRCARRCGAGALMCLLLTMSLQIGATRALASPATAQRWFSGSSLWNMPIEKNPQIAPDSTRWIQSLYRRGNQININLNRWSPIVLYADKSTPRANLHDHKNNWKLDNVPIPQELASGLTYFTATGDTDKGVDIVDIAKKLIYNLYGVQSAMDASGRPTYTFSAAGLYRLDGSGWWDNSLGPWSGRASGAALCAGAILPSDMKAMSIEHALAAAWPKELISPSCVPPAKTSDGGGPANALPMGACLQLDPSLTEADLKGYGLNSAQIAVACALQKYGVYIVDSSSVMAIYCQAGLGNGEQLYPGLTGLPNSLIPRFRVLTPRPSPLYDSAKSFGQPHL